MEPKKTAASPVWESKLGVKASVDNERYLKWAQHMTDYYKTIPQEIRGKGEQVTDIALSTFEKTHFSGTTTCLGVAREFARMGFRQVSLEAEATAAKLGLRLEHMAVTIGTVIHGVDLRREQTEETINFVHDVLMERKVVFFRDQDITIGQQVGFAHRFGPLDAFPFATHMPGEPFAARIANNVKSKPTAQNLWHSDVTWMERPSLGSILHMTEVPPVGGDTLFSDSHAAFLGLPIATRRRILGVQCPHDWRIFRVMQEKMGVDRETLDNLAKDVPFGVMHPLVRTHPETKKQALFLSPSFIRYESYLGPDGRHWPKEECEELMNALIVQHSKPEYQCRFKWEKGSMAFWDNRACQHYGAGDFWPYRRTGHRVTLSGDAPFYDPSIGDDAPKMADLVAAASQAASKL